MRSEVTRSAGPFLAVPLVAFLLASGCALVERTTAADSAVDRFSSADDELDFWDDVTTRAVVTSDDALHGLLLLDLGEGEAIPADYAGRVAAARGRGWLGGGDPPPKNDSATVGMIAVAVCQILDIRGGITGAVIGPTGRYCTRELVYREILPDRTALQSMTGLEFADLVSRVEDELTRVETPSPSGG